MEVPNGYRLIDEPGARAILERTKNPIPKGLIGILAPQSGQWWAVLEFTDVGYLKDAEKEQLDAGAILKAMRKQSNDESQKRSEKGLASVVSVDWERQPAYDTATHSLEWAFRAETQSAKTINDTLLLFGRNGVLEITAVQPYQATTDLAPLRELANGITFKEGQRYADYNDGDKIANISLLGLIVNDEGPASGNGLTASSAPGTAVWVICLLTGCLAGCGGWFLSRKLHHRRKMHSAVHTNGKGGGLNGLKQAFEEAVKNGNNGSKSNGGGPARPKKEFNYPKFYTDFVMMSNSSAVGAFVLNGKSRNNGSEAAQPREAGPGQGGVTVNLELIACQTSLIEEQRRLIQQQTRFIEEKSKLIEEQNELLERQSAMIENQFSLKFE